MKRAIRWIPAVLLLATGVNGLIWLVGLLAAQGLDRAEKILSVVAVPTTIAIGGVGLWLAWPRPVATAGASKAFGLDHLASRSWIAVGMVVSIALNVILLYVYLPRRLPELDSEIRVGVSGLHPGWSESSSGADIASATGFDMELVKFLEKRFPGNSWRIVQVDPVDREKSIVTGRVDLVVANYSMEGSAVAYDGPDKLQRREMIDFAGPYFVDRSGIMINPAKAEKIGSPAKVPAEKICVALGTTAEDFMNQADVTKPSRAQYRQQQDCFNRIMDPDDLSVVATVTDTMILKARARSMPDQPTVRLQSGKSGTAGEERYGIGMPNHRPKLCAALNAAIGDFLAATDKELNWNKAWDRHLSGVDEDPARHRPLPPEPQCPENA